MPEPAPLDEPAPEYWFPAKRYGYGWGLPATREGWVVSVGYLGSIIAGSLVSEGVGGLVAVVGAVPLLLVCRWKGEPARWRWGGR